MVASESIGNNIPSFSGSYLDGLERNEPKQRICGRDDVPGEQFLLL